jgi:hypothetical protein
MALYQKGQKDEARKLLAAAIASYDWSMEKAISREAWIAHILRREAESLIQPKPHDDVQSPPASQVPRERNGGCLPTAPQ